MLFAGSCIVADPPEYRAPGQTRPVLNMYSAVPSATQALVIDASPGRHPSVNFSVQVRSEDAGEYMRAVLYLDYQMLGEDSLVTKRIDPSTYDNVGRFFTHTWVPKPLVRGCHFLTLVVAHVSTYQGDNEQELDPRYADDDAALATWTVNVLDKLTDDTIFASCPTREGPTVP